MSIDFKPLKRHRENFQVTDAAPTYIDGGVVSANDMACLAAWFEIANSTVDVGNPGTVTIEYSPDDGVTWVTVPNTIGGTITADGSDWKISTTAATGIFPPLIRFKFIVAAGKVYNVVHIRRSFVTPGLVSALRSPAATAPVGSPTFVELSDGANAISPFDNYAINTQWTDATQAYKVPVSASLVGWDFTNNLRKEVRVDTNGDVQTKVMNFPASTSNTFTYNTVATIPVFSAATPANNIGSPSVQLAGQGLAPVEMGTGADSVLTPRVTLSTRHEDVTTPVSMRISDSTEFTTAHETYALNTQFVKAAQTLRLPVSAFLNGWDYTNNTRKELRTNTSGDLRVEQTNVPTSIISSNVLVPFNYDGIYPTYAALTDTYVYKLVAATVATVTITYTDATKAVISSIVRT